MTGERATRAACRRSSLLVLAAGALLAACSGPGDVERVGGAAQGTTYALQWLPTPGAPDAAAIRAAAEAELARIDALLSNYRADSVVERINAARTTEPLDAPPELTALLRAARTVHDASDGCFDPTVAPLVAAWGFDGTPRVPPPAAIDAARRSVGFDALEIDDAALVKRVPELEIDVSGIAQGYTADRLAALLEAHGIERYLVEIGGEIVARGTKPGGEHWRVAVQAPSPDAAPARVLTLPAARTAIATSGTYEHFFTADGRRYSHVLDPRTGRPVEHALVSATVLHDDAALADAWSTALLCLGPDDAKRTAERERIAAVLLIATDRGHEEWASPALAAALAEP